MSKSEVDVVVVGAGTAGLCCAATLLSEGLTTTLVCETPEVGWALRSVTLGRGSKGFVQHPVYQPGLGGGSWYTAARSLNVPVSFHVSPPLQLLNKDTGATAELRSCTSASAILDVLGDIAPMPIDEQRPGLEKVLRRALDLSWDELAALQRTPLSEWMEGDDADPIVAMVMYVLAANITVTSPAVAAEHLSVYGAMGMMRGMLCGEAFITAPSPDPWEGLLVPLGKALDGNGCVVRRGNKVDRVIVEDGRAVGVALLNGDEVRGRAVALAVGNPRIPALLPDPPDEIAAPLDYSARLVGHDACTFSLLDEPLVDLHNMTMVADQTGDNLAYLFPMQAIAPGSTEPGRYLLAAQARFSAAEFEAVGGHDGAVKMLVELQEEMYPGFENATVERKEQSHKHHWLNPLTHGPKLPAQSTDCHGLYFAGDGSTPILSVGVEAAGQAGVLRARQIAADLQERP